MPKDSSVKDSNIEKAVPDAEAFVTGEESSNVKEIVSNLNDVFVFLSKEHMKKYSRNLHLLNLYMIKYLLNSRDMYYVKYGGCYTRSSILPISM